MAASLGQIRAVGHRLAVPVDTGGVDVRSRYLFGALGALSLVSFVGMVLTPVLLDRPMLLVLLTPRAPFIVAAAVISPAAAFALGVGRSLIGDPFNFLIGRRHGAQFVPERCLRLFERVGVTAIAIRPTSKVLLVAGAGGTGFVPAAIADLVGTVAYVALLCMVGQAFW